MIAVLLGAVCFAAYMLGVYLPVKLLGKYVKSIDEYHDARLKRLEQQMPEEETEV